MNKKERVDAALKGERPDRVPVSAWGHDYPRERTAEGLAEAMLEAQARYDWDWMKVNPRAQYHDEPWGSAYEYPSDPTQAPVMTRVPVQAPSDWRKIEPLAVGQAPALQEQIRSLELIGRGLGGDVYFLETVFSPISVAYRLLGSDPAKLRQHMAEYSAELKQALAAIAETFQGFVAGCLEAGASGIFYASTRLSIRAVMSPEQHREFAEPYDRHVLAAASGASGFNILHICGDDILWKEMLDYPVQALSWNAAGAGNPSLSEARDRSGKAVVGGLDRELLLKGPEDVQRAARASIAETGGQKLLLGPSCSVHPATPEASLRAFRDAELGR